MWPILLPKFSAITIVLVPPDLTWPNQGYKIIVARPRCPPRKWALGTPLDICTKILHPAFYHLLHILVDHHDEIVRHLYLFQSLRTMVASLQVDAPAYGTGFKRLLSTSALCTRSPYPSRSFRNEFWDLQPSPCQEAMIHISSTFEDQITQVSNTVRAPN